MHPNGAAMRFVPGSGVNFQSVAWCNNLLTFN
jgi:hypothetical protein